MTSQMDSQAAIVGLNGLMFVLIICFCLFLGYKLKKYKVYYLPESGAAMLFGLLVGGIITLFGKIESDYVMFKPDVFFFILLPPIIFEAGYSLKRRDFFKNMSTILMFAVVGTVISTLVIGYGLFGLAKAGLVPLDSETPLESLLFGSLISAVDPVATLAILGAKEIDADPLLYSLVFGESVLNDAVSIVLFKSFDQFADRSNSDDLEDASAWQFIGMFCGIFVGSLLIGVATSLLCAFLLKRSNLKQYPSYEFTVLLLFAYGTYCLAEILEMSGIVSLFFSGILMAHYAWYNISSTSQSSTHHVFKSFAILAETFVFAYLGITAGVSFEPQLHLKWHAGLICFSILLCFVGRALNIFPLSWLANLRRKRKVSARMQTAMWFAGLRGAIAFALALNVPIYLPGRSYIVTTTLTIVFFTTLVCGGLTERVLAKLRLKGSGREDETAHVSTGFHRTFKHFDEKYLRPIFGGPNLRNRNRVIMIDGEQYSVQLPHEYSAELDDPSRSQLDRTALIDSPDSNAIRMMDMDPVDLDGDGDADADTARRDSSVELGAMHT